MLAYLRQLYGEGEKLDQFGTRFYWKSENVILNYEANMVMGDSRVSFFSKGLVNRYEKYLYDKKYGDQ